MVNGTTCHQCLAEIARLHESPVSTADILKGMPVEGDTLPIEFIPRAAKKIGLDIKMVETPIGEISPSLLPCLLVTDSGDVTLIRELTGDQANCYDPENKLYKLVPLATLNESYSGRAYFFAKTSKLGSIKGRFEGEEWFWKSIWLSKDIYKDVILATILINLFALASPLFVMNVYDRVVPNQALDTLATLIFAALIVFTFDFIYKLVRSHYLDIAGKKSDVVISSLLFEKLLKIKLANRPHSTGSFAKNLSDFDSVRDFVTSATMASLIDLPFIFVFLAVIAIIAGPLVIAPAVIIVCITLFSIAMSAKVKRVIEKTYESSAKKNGMLIETLNGIESIKLFKMESQQLRKWERATAEIALWSQKSRFMTQAASYSVAYAGQLNTILVVGFGVFLIFDGELSMGGLIATVILSGRALAPIGQLSSLILRYHNAKVAFDGLKNVMQLPVEYEDGKRYLHRSKFSGNFALKNVSFSFEGKEHNFVNDMSFEVKANDKVGVIGRIGSGKTTLSRLLTGLYEPSSGAVLLDGIDLRQIDPADLRADIASVTQDCYLFSGTVRENIVAAKPNASDEQIERAIIDSGVNDFIGADEEGIDKQVGERGALLSGGQRQAVALARALVQQTNILILDEPTSNLDKTSEKKLINKLKEVVKDKTLIMLTHNSAMLSLVDKLLVIDRGRVVAFGDKNEILKQTNSGSEE